MSDVLVSVEILQCDTHSSIRPANMRFTERYPNEVAYFEWAVDPYGLGEYVTGP